MSDHEDLGIAEGLDEQPTPMLGEARSESTYHKDLTLFGLIFLSLGDSIGSGLLFGSGTALKAAGPGGVFVSFIGATYTVFVLLTSLAEMSTRSPDTGGIITMCEHYIHDSSAFAIGYNTVMSKIAGTAVSMQAVSSCVHFWLPHVPPWVWGICTWVWSFSVNCLPVKYFSAIQSTMSTFEVIVVIALTLSLSLCALGVIGEGSEAGRSWQTESFRNGFWGFSDAWLIMTCAYDGADDIATTSGEAKETQKSLKRTIYVVFAVLVFVYGLNNAFLGIALSPSEPELGVTSPFTLVLKKAGIDIAAHIVNAIVIISICCMLLGYPYNQCRMARELAANGRGPAILSGLTSWGVPIPALLATMILSAVVYAISLFSEDAFACALEFSGVLTLIDWIMVSICLLRSRIAYRSVSSRIAPADYIAPCWPWGQVGLVIVCAIVKVSSISSSFVHQEVLKGSMALLGPVIIGCCFFIHRYRTGSKFVTIAQIEERLLASEENVSEMGSQVELATIPDFSSGRTDESQKEPYPANQAVSRHSHTVLGQELL
jgi:lysine-specific permease